MRLPNILSFPIYALDISDQSYKYLYLAKNADGTTVTVSDFGEGEIPPGVIEQGEIKKRDILVAILRDVFHKRNIRFVALSLPEEQGFLRSVPLSGIRQNEIAHALQYQLEEHIPLSPAEAFFDYTVASVEKDHIDVAVNAFPKQVVESYAALVYDAGATLVYMESELTSAFRATIPRGYLETAFIIDWGHTRTSFSIVEDGTLRFAATAPIGGKVLNEAIVKNLGVDVARAEALKVEMGFSRDVATLDVFNALVPAVTAVKEEAEKYIDFWQSHSERKASPEKIFLSGGDANLRGLPEYLSHEFGVEVSLANPWVNVAFPPRYLPDIELKDSLRFVSAIGLGIEGQREGEII